MSIKVGHASASFLRIGSIKIDKIALKMITHCNIGKKKRTFHVVLDSFVASRSPL